MVHYVNLHLYHAAHAVHQVCSETHAMLQGEHPKHKGVSDPQQLSTVERYFVEIMDIPRLQQRIDCFIFTRQFAPNIHRVSFIG